MTGAARSDARKRHAAQDAPRGHVIRWEFERDSVTATAICNEPEGADCRLTSVSCDCERWGEIQRRDDGTIWHRLTACYRDLTLPRDESQWHQVRPMDDCNVCLFINESGCVEELGHGYFFIADTPISPIWMDDGCEWEATS